MIEAEIRLMGGTRKIGRININDENINGRGGALSPFLDFPFSIEINEKMKDASLILWNIQVTLFVTTIDSQIQLSAPISLNLGLDGIHPSILSFPLDQSKIILIEKLRHKEKTKDISFSIKIEGQVAGIYRTENSINNNIPKEQIIFPHDFGMNSRVSFFHATKIDDLKIIIPQSVWVNILPDLGFNRIRMIEIELPDKGKYFGLIDSNEIIKLFDEAIFDHQVGRYKESIWKCRHVRETIEGALKATKDNNLSKIIGHKMGWETNDYRIKFIDNYWKALIDITNVASHSREFSFGVEEAKTCILSISVILDYFARLTDCKMVVIPECQS